jgi:spore germination cell wall hydrolase CwlJ-like protein
MTTSATILLLALTIWHEGRGEGEEGMRLIADTIANRAMIKPADPELEARLAAVVRASHQYECWDTRDIYSLDIPEQKSEAEKHAWKYCVALARLMVRGAYEPITTSTHYWRRGMELKAWQYDMQIVGEAGNHVFATKGQVKTTNEGAERA